jgi:holo-[acyl-carrier protein] synthase
MIIGIGSTNRYPRVAKIERHGDRFSTAFSEASAPGRRANGKMVVATYAKRFAAKAYSRRWAPASGGVSGGAIWGW